MVRVAEADGLEQLDRKVLEGMRAAGEDIRECHGVLTRTGDNVVGEVLRGQGTFYEWNHYPDGDVYDQESHSQFYYHAHPTELRGGEHGHFHPFVRVQGMPKDMRPLARAKGDDRLPKKKDRLAHLVGISMDAYGYPTSLFTVNRWVTGETWYGAADSIALLDRFAIGHAQPSWPVNRWITAMVCLFKSEMAEMLRQRDASVAAWQARHPERVAYEDRDLEVTSSCQIDVDAKLKAVAKALRAQG